MELSVIIFLISLPIVILALYFWLRNLEKKETPLIVEHKVSAGGQGNKRIPESEKFSNNFLVSKAYQQRSESEGLKNCLVEGNSLLEIGIKHGDIVGIKEIDDFNTHSCKSGDIIYLEKEKDCFVLREFLSMKDSEIMETVSYKKSRQKETFNEPLSSLKGTMLFYTTPTNA